jgi:hypothetical protein
MIFHLKFRGHGSSSAHRESKELGGFLHYDCFTPKSQVTISLSNHTSSPELHPVFLIPAAMPLIVSRMA